MLPEIDFPAPEFTLRDQHGATVALSEVVGKRPVVLVFFPLAFTGTCTEELGELRDNIAMFAEAGAALLAISVDSMATLREFADREHYPFALLSDFWPHGEVSRRYGVLLEDKGFATRGTFVIDRDGVLRARFVAGPGEARDVAAYRDALGVLRR